jgi:ABC-type protease/lipase transport system fused ATPase/permease subunit
MNKASSSTLPAFANAPTNPVILVAFTFYVAVGLEAVEVVVAGVLVVLAALTKALQLVVMPV